MKKSAFLPVVVLCAIAAAGSSAGAAAISVSEPPDFSSQHIGTLGLGDNLVSGSLFLDCSDISNCFGDSHDGFGFTIPAGLELVTASISYLASIGLEFYVTSNSLPIGGNLPTGSEQTQVILDEVVGAGEGDIDLYIFESSFDRAVADWEVKLTTRGVEVIPLPPALLLLLSGLGALAVVRSRA